MVWVDLGWLPENRAAFNEALACACFLGQTEWMNCSAVTAGEHHRPSQTHDSGPVEEIPVRCLGLASDAGSAQLGQRQASAPLPASIDPIW